MSAITDLTVTPEADHVKIEFPHPPNASSAWRGFRIYLRQLGANNWVLAHEIDRIPASEYHRIDLAHFLAGVEQELVITVLNSAPSGVIESSTMFGAVTFTPVDLSPRYRIIDLHGDDVILQHVEADSFRDEYEQATYNIIGGGRRVDRGEHIGAGGTLSGSFIDRPGITARRQRHDLERILANPSPEIHLQTPFGETFRVALSNLSLTRTPGIGLVDYEKWTLDWVELGRVTRSETEQRFVLSANQAESLTILGPTTLHDSAESFTVDWGDGFVSEVESADASDLTHEYVAPYSGAVTLTSKSGLRDLWLDGPWKVEVTDLSDGLNSFRCRSVTGAWHFTGQVANLPRSLTVLFAYGGAHSFSGNWADMPPQLEHLILGIEAGGEGISIHGEANSLANAANMLRFEVSRTSSTIDGDSSSFPLVERFSLIEADSDFAANPGDMGALASFKFGEAGMVADDFSYTTSAADLSACTYFTLAHVSVTPAEIEDILTDLDNNGLSNGTVIFGDSTPPPLTSSAPIIASLESKGWNVTVQQHKSEFTVTAGTTISFMRLDSVEGEDLTVTWGDGTPDTVVTSGGATDHTYATPFTGDISIATSSGIKHFGALGEFSFELTDLPTTLTFLQLIGAATVEGDIASVPRSLTTLIMRGNTKLSGNLSDLPPGMTNFQAAGFNNVSGDYASLPSNIIVASVTGPLNEVTFDDFSTIPPTARYVDLGGASSSGNGGPVSGDLSDLPSAVQAFAVYAGVGDHIISCTGGLSGQLTDVIIRGPLTETAVSNILVALDAAGATDGVAELAFGSSAVPNAAGLTAKASLEAKGWTVDVVTEQQVGLQVVNATSVTLTNLQSTDATALTVDWGNGASQTVAHGANASYSYSGEFSGLVTITSNGLKRLDLDGKFAFDLSALPDTLEHLDLNSATAISGDIANLPSSLLFYDDRGSSTVQGNCANLPAGLTYFRCWGTNSIHGNLSALPGGITAWICHGTSSASTQSSTLPSGITEFEQRSMDTPSVNRTLIALDNNGLSGGDCDIGFGYGVGPATGGGNTAKWSLQGKGWTVSTA